MSLFTLLEAARYLEYKSEASARGEEPHDYTTFTQLSSGGTTIATTPTSNHGNQNNNGKKDPNSGNNVPNGITNCHGSNSTNVNSNTSHINNLNGTVGSNNHANLGGTGQHQQQQYHHPQQQQQQQQQHANSNSSSSSNSPTLSFTLGTTCGTTPSLGSVGVLSTTGNTAALSSAGYRQRSGSAASRQRTDSLSSHDDSSRDPHNKQSRRSGGAGTREVHNKLEKNRRAHLKECFESLKKQLPNIQDDRKTSNLTILRSALRYIQNLKKKEREFEQQMEQLAREKISAQQRLATLRRDGSSVLPLHDNHSSHQLPHQSLSHHLQHQQHISTSSSSATTATTTTSSTNSRDTARSIGVVANTHLADVGSIDVQRRTLLVTAGTSDRVAEKLVVSELKRRGSVSPDNETTTTASECGNLSDYEGDEFEPVSHVGGQQQTLQNSINNNHSLSTAANSTSAKRERDHHQHHSHPLHHHPHHHHHRLGGTKTTTIPSTTTVAAPVTGTPTSIAATKISKIASNSAATAATVEVLTAAPVSAIGGGSLALGSIQDINTSSSNNNNNHKKNDDRNSTNANDVTSFNNLNSHGHTKSRQANSFNKELKAVDGVVVDTKEECKPITISVTSGSGASVIATAPAVNPIYQQATAGLHKTCRREIKEEPCDRKASIGSNGLGAAGSASQAIAFVATSTGATSKTLTGTTESSSEGVGAQIEVSPAATTVTMEPPRAIFTPGNQKTVLPTYLPNTGNLATLLHAANTVSYIKAASAVSNSTGAGGAPHSELTVNVSSAPMVSTGGSSMVASVVRPTMVPSMTSSMVPSMGQIPLMCKPGSVVRLAASGHLVQPLTLVQQIPAAAAANGVNGGTNGVTGKAGTAGSSQPAIGQATGHTHHPHSSQQATTTQLFLAQTGPAPGGAFKAPGAGVTPPGGNQPVTSMATVITQAAPSQTGHHGTQIVAGVAPIGKVQLGGATATLSIKPVSQFPLISGQQFITTSSQSLKPVVVVSVPQTSTQ